MPQVYPYLGSRLPRADLDMIAEVAASVGKLCCELGRVAAGKIFGAEIAIACAVAQHVIHDRQDRSSDSDCNLFRQFANPG
jgi:hypothetical protein